MGYKAVRKYVKKMNFLITSVVALLLPNLVENRIRNIAVRTVSPFSVRLPLFAHARTTRDTCANQDNRSNPTDKLYFQLLPFGVNRLWRESEHSPQSGVEVKIEWNRTSSAV